jgi:competence CoiA-like predicted nuclease
VQVDSYLPPTANTFGRYPDVLVRRIGLPAMAIEVRLSRTFQTEISARCSHYDRECMPLVWVLYGVDLDSGDVMPISQADIRRLRSDEARQARQRSMVLQQC